MGCGGSRKEHVEVRPEQKWDYISLNDFKSTSCWTPFAYCYLYISLLISMAVYGVDSFTAVQLLAFDQWPGTVKPVIEFDIQKWIFAVCIILSFVNLGYEHIRAQKVIRRGSVAESYLDNLAVRLESIRVGSGKGYKRFLVFAELTKSKKGAEYLALFTYFSLQSWFRVVVCSGPRQVINAITLIAVYEANLVPETSNDVGNTLLSFFSNLRHLAESQPMLVLILSGMIFTLFIWALTMLALIAGVLCWLLFLWSYIPKEDGSLSNYCARKANKRLMAIVAVKVNKGIAEEERRRKKAELKAAKKAGERPPEDIKPTLPDVGDDKLPVFPSLSRADTMSTLPPYASRPGTPGSIELNSLDQKRPMASRQGTMNSNYSARQPLVGGAAEFGRSASPAPSLPNTEYSGRTYVGQPPMGRMQSNTSMSREFGRSASPAPSLPNTEYSGRTYGGQPPMGRMQINTSMSREFGRSASPAPSLPNTEYSGRTYGGQTPMGHMQSNTSTPVTRGYTASPATYSSETVPALPRPGYPRSQQSGPSFNGAPSRFDSYDDYSSGRASPAPSMQSSARLAPAPQRSATGPMPPRGPQYPPQRNMTAPMSRPGDNYDNRPSTSGSQAPPQSRGGFGNGWNSDLENQRGGPGGPRY